MTEHCEAILTHADLSHSIHDCLGNKYFPTGVFIEGKLESDRRFIHSEKLLTGYYLTLSKLPAFLTSRLSAVYAKLEYGTQLFIA